MEENTNVVDVNEFVLSGEQFEVIRTELRQQNENLQTLNASIVHGTMFLILLCIFQFYALLRRGSKKGGV